MKPGTRLTVDSVARVRSSMSRAWFSGATMNTLITVTTVALVDIVGTRVTPNVRSSESLPDILARDKKFHVNLLSNQGVVDLDAGAGRDIPMNPEQSADSSRESQGDSDERQSKTT